MNDITRLLASLKRRSAHAKEFGDSITFVKLKDIDALVEALEKAQGMEAYWKTQCRGITDHCEELQARIAELEREKVALESVALAMRDEMRAEEKRVAELEESHAQVIQSRDHYKPMLEEGLKKLAEPCAVSAESFTCPRCGRTTTHPEGWHYCHKREAE
ncbi:TPA: hypothetical protein RK250_005001 [Klebsiella oxytoca]|nr:hypothetical protein [Klebsiella oxytoca]HDW1416155.1 hypothetical protein [Klebsiella oxytoca]